MSVYEKDPDVNRGFLTPDNEEQPYNSTSNGYVNQWPVFSGQGRLFGFSGYSSRTSTQFILVFDVAGVPPSGATAVIVIPVTAGNTAGGGLFSGYFGPMGRWFRNGCYIANSSTSPTLTIGSADTMIDAQYL